MQKEEDRQLKSFICAILNFTPNNIVRLIDCWVMSGFCLIAVIDAIR